MAFSTKTRERLLRAGWADDRVVDVEPVVRALTAMGYEVGDAGVGFLRSYGSLEVFYPHRRDPTSPDGCHFDAVTAARNIPPATVQWFGERVGSALVPIGEADSGHMTLMMAKDGVVYGGYDPYMWKVGANGDDAIEALCTGRDLEELPEPDE